MKYKCTVSIDCWSTKKNLLLSVYCLYFRKENLPQRVNNNC